MHFIVHMLCVKHGICCYMCICGTVSMVMHVVLYLLRFQESVVVKPSASCEEPKKKTSSAGH